MMNNILFARDGQPVNTVSDDISDRGNTHITRMNNLYFGGGTPPIQGENDKIADPLFLNASVEANVADFHLKSGSPAIAAGRRDLFAPLVRFGWQGAGRNPDFGGA